MEQVFNVHIIIEVDQTYRNSLKQRKAERLFGTNARLLFSAFCGQRVCTEMAHKRSVNQ